ncbi:hypothetical protein GCM10028827_17480 [Mucilaginibacter myungsuensis]
MITTGRIALFTISQDFEVIDPKSPRLSGEALDERGAETIVGVCPFADLANEGHTPDPAQAGKRDFNLF